MSAASETFSLAIQDAEHLLGHFDKLNSNPPPPENEVLKRAGLVMAMTAWETYVEDRLCEATDRRVANLGDQAIAGLVRSKLDQEISKLHNPTAEKSTELFRDYAGIDIKANWKWHGVDPETPASA